MKQIKIHMKDRKVVEIPEANLSTFKRIFHNQIDFIEEDEQMPIISKPVIQEIKKPVVVPVVVDNEPSLDTLTKTQLQKKAKELNIEIKAADTKDVLIAKINSI